MQHEATIYVVDNDSAGAQLVQALAKEMQIGCEVYTSGTAFLDGFDPNRHGCLVSELRMADMSGPQIQRRLAAQGAPLPIVFLSAHATVPVVVRVLREGAATVLEKPADEQTLWEAVQGALRLDAERRHIEAHRMEVRARFATLTRAEREVCVLVFGGMTNKQIASRQNVSLRTVELRRSKLMRKLGAESLPELLRLVLSLNGCPHPAQCAEMVHYRLNGPEAHLQSGGNGHSRCRPGMGVVDSLIAQSCPAGPQSNVPPGSLSGSSPHGGSVRKGFALR